MTISVAAVPDSTSSGPLGLLQGFARGGDTRLRRAVGAAVTVMAVAEIAKGWYQRGHARLVHTVTLSQDDEIYTTVHDWLLKSLPSRHRRALKVSTRGTRSNNPGQLSVPTDSVRERPQRHLRVFYDGSRRHSIEIAGHIIKVDVHKDDIGSINSFEDLQRWKPERIVFTCRTESAREAVIEFLNELATSEFETMTPRLFVLDRWGSGWNRVELPVRRMDTVVLRRGQREQIVVSLQKFLDEEPAYTRLGIPWHRGYLFHGPPGTGKTSLAKALAGHFGLDVYYVPLSDLKNDTNLLQMFASIPARSMLLLEDIDVVHAAKSRDDSESTGISLSGLLNALDGLATPHGLITVMTTNSIDTLDAALIRPGRADWVEELGYLDRDQLQRLVALAIPDAPKLDRGTTRSNIAHAEVLEVIKRHLDNPADALAAVKDYLNG